MDRLCENLEFSNDIAVLKSSTLSLLHWIDVEINAVMESKVMEHVIPLMDHSNPIIQLQATAAVIHFFYGDPKKLQHLFDCGFLDFFHKKQWIGKYECISSSEDISKDCKKKFLDFLNTKYYSLLVAEVKQKRSHEMTAFPFSDADDLEIILLHLTDATIPQFCSVLENSSSELFLKTLEIVKNI